MLVCGCVLEPPKVLGFAQAVWDCERVCERASSVKDTIRQGVKGRGGEE